MERQGSRLGERLFVAVCLLAVSLPLGLLLFLLGGLVKDGDLVFMEVRPRTSLMPGEYAIIGDDLARIATFRVVLAAN